MAIKIDGDIAEFRGKSFQLFTFCALSFVRWYLKFSTDAEGKTTDEIEWLNIPAKREKNMKLVIWRVKFIHVFLRKLRNSRSFTAVDFNIKVRQKSSSLNSAKSYIVTQMQIIIELIVFHRKLMNKLMMQSMPQRTHNKLP